MDHRGMSPWKKRFPIGKEFQQASACLDSSGIAAMAELPLVALTLLTQMAVGFAVLLRWRSHPIPGACAAGHWRAASAQED